MFALLFLLLKWNKKECRNISRWWYNRRNNNGR